MKKNEELKRIEFLYLILKLEVELIKANFDKPLFDALQNKIEQMKLIIDY